MCFNNGVWHIRYCAVKSEGEVNKTKIERKMFDKNKFYKIKERRKNKDRQWRIYSNTLCRKITRNWLRHRNSIFVKFVKCFWRFYTNFEQTICHKFCNANGIFYVVYKFCANFFITFSTYTENKNAKNIIMSGITSLGPVLKMK